jgi:hypothetical protein
VVPLFQVDVAANIKTWISCRNTCFDLVMLQVQLVLKLQFYLLLKKQNRLQVQLVVLVAEVQYQVRQIYQLLNHQRSTLLVKGERIN